MTLREKQTKFICMVADLISWADAQGLIITGGELQRTKEQQQLYVKQGKSQTMNSKHIDKLAIDLNLFSSQGKYLTSVEAYKPLGEYWKSLDPENNVWGGDWTSFKDAVHFQSF